MKVSILRMENHNSDIDLKFRDKLELFGKLSCNLTGKLESLLYLSENYTSTSNDFKQFTNGIVGLWISVNKQIYDKCSKIRMASRTQSGVPLSLLLKKIKKEKSLTRESLHVHEGEYSREQLVKCYVLLDEIDDLINSLERCDDKAPVLKLTPFLVKLESVVDAYVSSIEISPINKSECLKLDAFAIVAKLLTGELLDNEPMDPYHVLMDNVPKKPVFIIKTKRRLDVPSISISETT
ncbi:hypothetical protein X777_12136 [Ooceraea biroi]|uniref:Uncharacterized protein n=1 Tax=Ooceraea biroi TaxID=2015173 RepID=A0A026W1Y9_OOCBI|nr:hypothetical protein X777_12136 [Ooceraea biroi]